MPAGTACPGPTAAFAGRNGPDGRGAARNGLGGRGAARVLDVAALGLARGVFPQLNRRDVVVAAPPCGDPDSYTSLLDLVLASGATTAAAPLPQVAAAVDAFKATTAIVPRGTDLPALPPGRILTVS